MAGYRPRFGSIAGGARLGEAREDAMIDALPTIDWSVVNTALILGAIGYLYRQARIVDQVKQALLGINGRGGALEEIQLLRQRSHELANALQVLNGTVELLTHEMRQMRPRQPGEE